MSGLVVAADSAIKTGKDLDGKLVGVSSLGSIDQIAVERWIDTNGGDSQTVKFVELQNGVMPEAVSTGRVAAAYAADPVYTSGLQDGKVRLLAHAFESIARRYMIVGWFSSTSWADANPDAARKFATAINEGSAWAVKNPEAAMAVLGKYMKVTSARRPRVSCPQPRIPGCCNHCSMRPCATKRSRSRSTRAISSGRRELRP